MKNQFLICFFFISTFFLNAQSILIDAKGGETLLSFESIYDDVKEELFGYAAIYLVEKKVNNKEALYYIKIYDKNLTKLGEKSLEASKHYGANFFTKNANMWSIGNFNGNSIPINVIGYATKSLITTGLSGIRSSLHKSFLYNIKTNSITESDDFVLDYTKFKLIDEHKGTYFSPPISIDNKGFLIVQQKIKKFQEGNLIAFDNNFKEVWKNGIKITGNPKDLIDIKFETISDLTVVTEIHEKPDTNLIYSIIDQNNGQIKYSIKLSQDSYKYEPLKFIVANDSISIFGDLHELKKIYQKENQWACFVENMIKTRGN